MVYSGAWGKLIHEKNQKQKISWHCPFQVWNDSLQTFKNSYKNVHTKENIVTVAIFIF